MIRTTLLVIAGLIVVGGIVYGIHHGNTVSVTNPVASSTTATTTPQYPVEWTAEAQAAYQSVIKRKELEAEASTTQAQLKADQAKLDSINQELKKY